MKRNAVGSLLLGVGCATALLAGEPPPLTLRTVTQEGSAPKFIETGSTVTGLCPEMLAALERIDKGLRFQIDPRPTPIKRIESELRDGRIDVVCALLETSQRNEMAYRVSTPLYVLQERLVGRRDDAGVIQGLHDLAQAGDLVVTQSGASYADKLRRAGVQVIETPGGSAVALRNVANKRARFYYTNDLTGAYYIHNEGLAEQLRLHPGVIQSSPSYLWAAHQLDANTQRRLEQAVAQARRSGELERIYQRYVREQP
jgi:ABC-type amino acid transport substrate-binding protein